MMDNATALTKARELITPPAAWAQDDYAYSADWQHVVPTDPKATCWCSVGALLKVLELPTETHDHPTFDILERVVGMSIPSFNDSATHEEVLAAFDKAIELAKVNHAPA